MKTIIRAAILVLIKSRELDRIEDPARNHMPSARLRPVNKPGFNCVLKIHTAKQKPFKSNGEQSYVLKTFLFPDNFHSNFRFA